MLGSLRTPDYRRTIAEVVTRDFTQEINELRGLATNAKNSYIQSLGEVECDRAKIDLHKPQDDSVVDCQQPTHIRGWQWNIFHGKRENFRATGCPVEDEEVLLQLWQ
jgi:hypothetical protein